MACLTKMFANFPHFSNISSSCSFFLFERLSHLQLWDLCHVGVIIYSRFQDKFSSFQIDHAFTIKPKNWIALNDDKTATDKASCQSPRCCITACIPEAGDDIFRKKEPLSSTVESLKWYTHPLYPSFKWGQVRKKGIICLLYFT